MKSQALVRRCPAQPLLHACGFVLAVALAFAAAQARADDTPAAPLIEENAQAVAEMQQEPGSPPPLRVGDATGALLAWQRSGEIASPTPRPIAGPVAFRSYERYLKSFEHPIPEYLNSSVKKAPGDSGK
ncbi:hypothetical protein M2165_001212 [Variovorax sp. TBS-050B]|uniref:DUF3613 domain-containing protein n=1 Tax=Variovorax sp. TBS-050B TaxID=2940551 RepID=UPI002474977C|nr:DUF3613 domain-containing protein [Variovorax sp. TBS-050B]MDH6591323.1 hypothetical protein [Variovorax sp. TBS-050B]